MKVYGQLEGAQLENRSADGAGVRGQMIFNYTSGLQKYHDGTGWRVIVDTVFLATAALANPMTSPGDLMYGATAGAVTRLGAGSAGELLMTGAAPSWGKLADANVASGAAIALTKLAASTALRVPFFDGSGLLSPSGVSATSLFYLDATSSIQTQLNALAAGTSPLTAKGDLFGFTTVQARIPVGSNGQVLVADSSQALGVKWNTPSGGLVSVEQAADLNPAVTNISYNYGTLVAARTLTLPTGTTAFSIEVLGSADSTNTLSVAGVNGNTEVYRYANFTAVYYRAAGSSIVSVARQATTLIAGGTLPGLYGGFIGDTITGTDSSLRTIGATLTTVYSSASVSISVPPGNWLLSFNVTAQTGFSTGTGDAFSLARIQNTTDGTTHLKSSGGYLSVNAGVSTPGALFVNHAGSKPVVIPPGANKTFEIQVGWQYNSGSCAGQTQYARNDLGTPHLTATRIG